jgi:hypothetical protein
MKIYNNLSILAKKILSRWPARYLLCLGFFLLLCDSAFAQILIDNLSKKYTVKPGEVIGGAIKIANSGNSPVGVRIYFEDFRYKEPFDGAKEFLPPGTLPDSCAQWLSYSPQDVTLSPFKKQDVAYSFKVPAGVKEGGYYGVLFFETILSKAGGKTIGGGISTRVGCLFFLETETKSKKTNIEAVKINKGKLGANFITQSNAVVIAKGTYYIMSDDGATVVARGKIDELYLPLQSSAPFSITLPVKNVADGKYILGMTFDLGDNDSLVKEVELSYTIGEGYKIIKVND